MDYGELNNQRVLALAKAHDCTVEQVNTALDRHPIEIDRDLFLKRTLALELMRLDELETAFEGKALRDKDVASGLLLVKFAKRRQIVLGLAAPAGHAVTIVHKEAVEQKTSTERIAAAIARIRGESKPPPEAHEVVPSLCPIAHRRVIRKSLILFSIVGLDPSPP
jgi:hypothetical protein